MKNYRNNFKRNRYRNNQERTFKTNGSSHHFNGDFQMTNDFKRRKPSRNNHNASKLMEKYTALAKEALSKGDKILSENYYQHADHFLRISEAQNINKQDKKSHENTENVDNKSLTNSKNENPID